MDTVERTLIVRTVVKWFSVLAKRGRQLEPYGSSGRKHNLGYGKPRITIVRRSCEDGDQWNRWWEVRIEPKTQLRIEPRIQLKIEPRVQHNDAWKRNITISPISWVSMGHKRN